MDVSSDAQLSNISARGTVQTGDDVMIGGFIVKGDTTKVLVRAIGPSLTDRAVTGALAGAPSQLYNSSDTLIGWNDDWQSDQKGDRGDGRAAD